MILEIYKTIDMLKDVIINTGISSTITADNLDEIELTTDVRDINETDDDVVVENEHGTQFNMEELSDNELIFFCAICDVQPIYNIKESAEELKNYIISQIKPWEYGEGELTPFIHNPDDEEGCTNRIHFIDDKGWVCVTNHYASDETESFHLSSLLIDDLLSIYNIQCNSVAQ